MWTTVLALALSVIFEPVRVGLVVLMLNRRRPLLQLVTFLCGGYAMGFGVGLILLFALGAALGSAPASGRFTVAQVQIATGVIALLIAVALANHASVRRLTRRDPVKATAAGGGDTARPNPPDQPVPAGRQTHADRVKRLMRGDSLLVAAVSGMGSALPSANSMGAMAAILASRAAPGTAAQALFVFNAIAFTMAEIPLLSYLVAPQKTREFMAGVQTWLRSRGHRDVALLVAAGGCFMLVIGLINLR